MTIYAQEVFCRNCRKLTKLKRADMSEGDESPEYGAVTVCCESEEFDGDEAEFCSYLGEKLGKALIDDCSLTLKQLELIEAWMHEGKQHCGDTITKLMAVVEEAMRRQP